ncbi:hypothetical protein BESB_039840 [Besnoitia besnoiti]|uniref:EF hand protein n=1 Tax=Besnoitia besnoiti TaxID=94643 RepID=A0A2A9MMZ7_BESBE|nr:hypothetical protein BESB_039840 [Besnoitia besnoiti]PFH37526.1 hypothetical protein BESB_039840 [Besnoitia besnoiti]
MTLNMTTAHKDPPTVEEVEKRIKSIVFPKRIRIQEFIRRFDQLHHRVVGQQQFVRALDQCGVVLDLEEAEALCHAYADEKTGGVRYYDFCNSINTVFRVTQAEENPQLEPPHPGACLPPPFTPKPLAEDKRNLLADIMHRLALLTKTRGIVFKYCYRDFDKLRSGYVSRAVFRRKFPFEFAEGKFTEEEIAIVADHFSREDTDVNYMFIHNILKEKVTDHCLPFATSPYVPRPSTRHWEHEDLVPERKIQEDWDYLVEKYSRGDGMFNYAALCRAVNKAFTIEDLDKHPLKRVNMPGNAVTEPAQRNRIRILAQEEAEIKNVEQVIRTKVAQTRKAIKPTFQDFDKQRTMHVSKSQLSRIMSMLGLPLSERELSLLCLRYCDKGNENDFNYLEFVRSVDVQDEPQPDDRTITDTLGSVYFTGRGESPRCIHRPHK